MTWYNPTWPAIHRAIYRDRLEKLQELIKNGADINSENDEGDTPLILAAIEGFQYVVEFLINAGANINCYTKYYKMTVLHFASGSGWLSIVKSLVEKGIDINAENVQGESPLILAAFHEYPDIVEFLLGAGANINCRNEYEWTVLHCASFRGWLDIARSVLEKGIDIDAKTESGKTALMLAAEENHLDMVKLLVHEGANIDCRDWESKGELIAKELRVEKDIDVTDNVFRGNTALLLAADLDHKEIVKFLISAGANVNCRNEYECTVLHTAVYDNWLDIAQSLLEKGADVNCRTSKGLAPLYVACRYADKELIELFTDVGADCNAENDGESPLTVLIKEWEDVELVKLLIEKGAFMKSKDYNLILEKPLLKEGILQDIDLCSGIIIDKFNNRDLPRLYQLANILPPIEKINIRVGSKAAQDVMQSVKHEIQTNGHCNVLEAHPIVLSIMCVKSFIEYLEQ